MIGIIHQELQPDHCHKRRNIFEVWREKKKSLLITCFQLYSERQKYGINSLKIKQNFFQKNLWTGQF
jgi:hypothetical protein